MGGLTQQLQLYTQSDYYPFHMPGHKRNPAFLQMPPAAALDITEIDGFDDLHRARGILREAQERAARVRGVSRSWFVVNGSTGGILAALSACVMPGGEVLVARNCHRSVYHAIELMGMRPVYLYPRVHAHYGICDGVSAQETARLLAAHPQVQAVVITSPTYEGVISDIRGIACEAHHRGVPLIVDSAHGAHLGYGGGFGPSACTEGADLVIESLHKTLPAMTQTALVHMNGTRADADRLQKYLSMYQTSSPSYVLMASIDSCMELLQEQAKPLFDAYRERLNRLRSGLDGVETVHSEGEQRPCRIVLPGGRQLCRQPGTFYDDAKLVLYIEGIRQAGPWLTDVLRKEYHLEMEMTASDYVLGMTSICDTDEGFDRLRAAVAKINDRLADGLLPPGTTRRTDAGKAQRFAFAAQGEEVPCMCSSEAVRLPQDLVQPQEAVGRISTAYWYVYPPGIPFLVPGERITQEILTEADWCMEAGISVTGPVRLQDGTCRVPVAAGRR